MKRSGIAVAAGAVATLLAGSLAPLAHAAPSLVTLKNGLRVVLAPDPGATAVDLGVWYPVGIGAEGEALGARHLIERLMFRGSANVADGEHVKRIVAEGGTPNTQLQLDYSSLFETVPAEALGAALALEADRMAGLQTSPEAFEDARRASLADVRGRETRPVVTRAIARLGAAVYRGTPYERAVEGDEAALAKMTPASIQAWRRGHYGPGNAVLSIVGRFDPVATLAVVKQLFEPLPKGVSAPGAAKKAAPPLAGGRVWQNDAGVPARLLLVGWRLPGAGDADAAAIEMLSAVLGTSEPTGFTAGMTARFASASFAQSGLDRHRDASMLWTVVALTPAADSAATELQVKDIVGGLRRDPVAADDLDRIRNRFTTAELLREQPVRARAQALGDALLQSGDLASDARREEALAKVTPEDLQRVANRVLTDAACSVVWLVPAGGAR